MSVTINLAFEGYWRAVNKGGLPPKPGVYGVYASTYDAKAQTVSLRRLLYVGESADVRGRVDGHEHWDDWEAYLRDGEILCFNFAPISKERRDRAEAALIFHHQPPVNTEYTNSFPFDTTTVKVTGKAAKLSPSFTVSARARKSA